LRYFINFKDKIEIYTTFSVTILDKNRWRRENCIVLKPGLVGRPGTRPTRGWNRAELKKKQGKKKSDVSRLTRQDLVKNSVAIH
jgi:hypothetical protein